MRSSAQAPRSRGSEQRHFDDPETVGALRHLGAIVVLDSVGDVKNVDLSGADNVDVVYLRSDPARNHR